VYSRKLSCRFSSGFSELSNRGTRKKDRTIRPRSPLSYTTMAPDDVEEGRRMGSRQASWGIGIGAAIGAILVAVSFDYLAFWPGALGAGIGALVGALVGGALGRR
jgi:hypothetical protein